MTAFYSLSEMKSKPTAEREEEESGQGGLRRVELPKSPKGSLEVCGQRFNMIAASTAVCFLPALSSCSAVGMELDRGTERWVHAERGFARHTQ